MAAPCVRNASVISRRRLHWMPHHDARQTLRQTVAAVRSRD
jgi:hypothetical protein